MIEKFLFKKVETWVFVLLLVTTLFVATLLLFLGIYDGQSIPGKVIYRMNKISKYLQDYKNGNLKITGFEVKNKFCKISSITTFVAP